MDKATIFDIQKFSVHDGPGIRTNVFFKGCSLACKWCCNPESQSRNLEIGFNAAKCIGCGSCANACSQGAIENENGLRRINRDYCKRCQGHDCIYACKAKAMTLFGKAVAVEELMQEIEQDELFYATSGGGVTASGGEALLQADFLRELFRACKARGYHTAIETCSYCSWQAFEKVLDVTDLFLCDIKQLDAAKFREMTGGDVKIPLENIKKLSECNKPIVIRVPVIPEFNDDLASIRAICAFAHELRLKEIHFLPYHAMGKAKYEQLDRRYELELLTPPSEERMSELCKPAEEFGLFVQTGG